MVSYDRAPKLLSDGLSARRAATTLENLWKIAIALSDRW
jgi:hypothetical protein